MISPKLEKLAILGRADWDVVPVGFAETATIKVPGNGFLILRQIIYNHFYDPLPTAQFTDLDIIKRSVHSLSIVEKGGKNELYYNLRSPVITSGIFPAAVIGNISAGPTIIETYKIFRKDVCIDVTTWEDFKDFTSVGQFLDDNSEERPHPLGYGTQNNGGDILTAQVNMPSGLKYLPDGDSRRFPGINPVQPNFTDKARNWHYINTQVVPLPGRNGTDTQNTAPLINLGFWRVAGQPEDLLKD